MNEKQTGDALALEQFLSIYCGSQRSNTKAWLDYFTSSAFLQAARDPHFTAQLLEEIKKNQETFPLSRELQTCLSIAYSADACDCFEAMRSIEEILGKRRNLTRMDLILSQSFLEYWKLVALAERNVWKDPEYIAYMKVLDRHKLSHIQDRYDAFTAQGARHPLGVKLLAHFFEQYPLTETHLRLAWKSLDLKSAKLGRPQILYGSIRSLILERIPQLEEDPEEKFGLVHHEFIACCAKYNCRSKRDPEQDSKDIEAFWNVENREAALMNPYFAFENLVDGIWISSTTPAPLLKKILEFYKSHPEVLYSETIIRMIGDVKSDPESLYSETDAEMVDDDLDEDLEDDLDEELEDEAIPQDGVPSLSDHSFFSYWLSVCNRIVSSQAISIFLMANHPSSYGWRCDFLDIDRLDKTPMSQYRSIHCAFQDKDEVAKVEIRFFLNHMDFWVNGSYVFRPIFDWDWLAKMEDCDIFFYLLPITVTFSDRTAAVKQEILHRLSITVPFLDDNELNLLSAELAKHVCCIPSEELFDLSTGAPTAITAEDLLSTLPCCVLMEGYDNLWGCNWSSDKPELTVFTHVRYRNVVDSVLSFPDVSDEEMAQIAMETLQTLIRPLDYCVSKITVPPVAVYADPNLEEIEKDPEHIRANMPRELLKEQITKESLVELLSLFESGKINRLEISWEIELFHNVQQNYPGRRSLVFIKEDEKQVCMCFDDAEGEVYALECPCSSDSSQTYFVPFGLDQLFPKHVHSSFSTIRNQLKFVFESMNYPNGTKSWSQAMIVYHGRNKYNMDKRMLGGFPVEWAHNSISEKYYMEDYPSTISATNLQDVCDSYAITSSNRFKFQSVMQQFMKGQLKKLCLSWFGVNHIVLLRDDTRYLFAFLKDENQSALLSVADLDAYKNADSSEEDFLGHAIPSYLIYRDPEHLRAAVELLFAKILTFLLFADKMPPYLDAASLFSRTYDEIRSDILG